jgi:homoserine kinase type II
MAVYTILSREQVSGFLSAYDACDLVAFEGITEGIDNTNYKIETTKGTFILTVFESRVDARDLPFFFAFMVHLASRGIVCPAPIVPLSGDIVRNIAGKAAALISFLEGKNISPSAITQEICEDIGRFSAQMHLAAMDFPLSKQNAMSFPAWKDRLEKIKQHPPIQTLPRRGGRGNPSPLTGEGQDGGDIAVLVELITDEIARLESVWPQDLPKATIHADLFPDNVFEIDGRVRGVIDFYFSCTDFLAYDLAITVNAWCFDEENIFRPERFSALLNGYESLRPLTEGEKQAFPVLARGAALRFLVSRLHDLVYHDPSAQVVPKDPNAYLARLNFWRSDDGKIFG